MGKHYYLFDFQDVINQLRKSNNKENGYDKVIENIHENSVIEDLPFYKDYLSKFDVEHALEGFKIEAEDQTMATHDDMMLLLRLIAASFSSSYEFLYDHSENSADMMVTAETGSVSSSLAVSEMYSSQIVQILKIYINEQINICAMAYDPEEAEAIEHDREVRLQIFDEKVRQLWKQQSSDDILSELEELLKS